MSPPGRRRSPPLCHPGGGVSAPPPASRSRLAPPQRKIHSRSHQARESPKISFPRPGRGASTTARDKRATSLNVRSRLIFVSFAALREMWRLAATGGTKDGDGQGATAGRGGSFLRNQNPHFKAGKDLWSGCQEPVTRAAPQRPKRQRGDRQSRQGDHGLEGERANASHPSQVPVEPFSGLGDPEALDKELDCRVTQNRVVLISSADVGSRPPCSCPRTQALRRPIALGPRGF